MTRCFCKIYTHNNLTLSESCKYIAKSNYICYTERKYKGGEGDMNANWKQQGCAVPLPKDVLHLYTGGGV